ncbi:uncharacterized protein TNCV_3421971 [Trichonephila clavipes]|nr:uncharacterized protein TNCV_3421971 [Trichonephila clavipes]
MATGSFFDFIQSEIQGDLHNDAQRINPENRVGSGFRIIPEQYFSGVENINDFLENIDNNLAYYEIPVQLACAYLKGHLKGRALDWFEVLGYRVIEDKANLYYSTMGHGSGEIFYFGGGLPQILFIPTSSKDEGQSLNSTRSPV